MLTSKHGSFKKSMGQLWSLLLVLALIMSCERKHDGNKEKMPTQKEELAAYPDDMVVIPSGEFEMGGKSDQAEKDELPRHRVLVSSFLMDITEVTNRQFQKFTSETGYKTDAERDIDWDQMKNQLPPGTPKPADSVLAAGSLVFHKTDGPVNLSDFSQWWSWTIGASWKNPEGASTSIADKLDHPVVHVSYNDALAYAKWANKRLPTEAEWEWASMGGRSDIKYPWGNQSADEAYDKANFWQGIFPFRNTLKDGFETTAPVKSYEPNGYGLYDMSGNVWEWCSDKYRPDYYQSLNAKALNSNPKGPETSYDPDEPYSDKNVLRGGSFLCNDSYCSGYRVARRMKGSRDTGLNHSGFRCVRDLIK